MLTDEVHDHRQCIRLWVNDVLTVEFTEQDATIPLHGIIGLQLHKTQERDGNPLQGSCHRGTRNQVRTLDANEWGFEHFSPPAHESRLCRFPALTPTHRSSQLGHLKQVQPQQLESCSSALPDTQAIWQSAVLTAVVVFTSSRWRESGVPPAGSSYRRWACSKRRGRCVF